MARQQKITLMQKLRSLLHQVKNKKMTLKQKCIEDISSPSKKHDEDGAEKLSQRANRLLKKELPIHKTPITKPKNRTDRRRQRKLRKRRHNSPTPVFSPQPPADLLKRRHRRQRRRELRGRLPSIRRFCANDS